MTAFNPDQILFEDNHLIAVNKLAGQLVQGDKTGDLSLIDLLKEYLKITYNKPGNVFLGCIHRIDRPVSGVCIFAKTSKSLARMNKLFVDRTIEKIYFAAVSEKPTKQTDRLTNYLYKDQRKNKSFVSSSKNKEAKKAILDYTLVHSSESFNVLKIKLATGRPHQIRVQLAFNLSPIIGDLKYGYPKSNADHSICLHCQALKFIHPVSKQDIEIITGIPKIPEWQNFKSS